MKKLINVFGYVCIFGLLFNIAILNIEKLAEFQFDDIYTWVFIVYFLGSIILSGVQKIGNKQRIKEKFPVLNFLFLKESEYIVQFILFFCLLLIPGMLINHIFLTENIGEANLYLRGYGKIAMLYFAFALVISPLSQFVKHPVGIKHLIFSRKILGILSFIFFLKHGLEYFALEYIFQQQYHMDTPYFNYVYENILQRWDAITGIIAGVILLLLGMTSNMFSQKILGGKKWKRVQSLVFPGFILSAVHIAFTSRFEGFYVFLIAGVALARLVAYLNRKQRRSSGKIIGYRCIPCGYIYDEKIGDPDSGILPGTRFEDIPDDWRCPVCGVGKDDFEPIYDGEQDILDGKIVGYTMLTHNVLELKIIVEEKQDVLPGQFANIFMEDGDGKFIRSYSVVKYENNILTFCIKLKAIGTGRGSDILRKSCVGDTILFGGIYGKFVLQNTKNPKVFIATGTGLSPIMNMLYTLPLSQKSILFFGVASQKDVFYGDKISRIENLKTKLFLSREQLPGYEFGRIDLSKYTFPENTEFYICGNPSLVQDTRKYLFENGYKNVYSEEF